MIIAALALAGVFVALYLTLYKVGTIGHLACGFGSCERVNSSKWAVFFGAPVAMWGLGFYVTTLIVAVVGTAPSYAGRREISYLLAAMSGIGVAFSAWLTYLELFVIDAICRYCVMSAVIVTLIFVVSVVDVVDVAAKGGDELRARGDGVGS
ncbi:MAG: vitamin K epoxide reductase family protein [Gemmatimonadota bacterium]|nr:vitamin K epoxide reductase family protein [Gemmatimonadota bacterium]